MSPIHNSSSKIEHNFDIEDGDSNIFEGFLGIGAQSTPQKPRFMDGGLDRSILSTGKAQLKKKKKKKKKTSHHVHETKS
jgi:hypothetical protein